MLPKANYKMLLTSFIILLILLFVYVNRLYYSISLLLIVLVLLSFIVSVSLIRSLTILILCIVYFGAIIILIGYICAICPNVNISSQFSFTLLFIIIILSLTIFISISFINSSYSLVRITGFFYSSYGIFIFITLIFILLLTLLIVTSQYLTPKAPFRSVS
jgi:hypothetical protein